MKAGQGLKSSLATQKHTWRYTKMWVIWAPTWTFCSNSHKKRLFNVYLCLLRIAVW